MNVLLQRHCAKHIYVVPEGLRELMSDISREVLRSQPEQIYTFIADYLDALMITRENARVAARFVENLTEVGITIAELLLRTGMTREEADRVATIIQTAFRKYLADKTALHQRHASEPVEEANIITEILDQAGITAEQAEQAAIIIQHAYRLFKRRQENEKDLLKGMVDWRVAARSTMRLYRKTGVTYEEANRAATLIKAAYKGYYTRKIMRKLLEQSEEISTAETKSLEGEAMEYPSYWQEQTEEEASFIEFDKDEELHIPLVSLEDSQTIATSIIDSLLNLAVPSSATTLSQTQMEQLSPSSEALGVPPSSTEDEQLESPSPATTEVPTEEPGTTDEPPSEAPTDAAPSAAEETPAAATDTDRTDATEIPGDMSEATETPATEEEA